MAAKVVRCMLCAAEYPTARAYLTHDCRTPPPRRVERVRRQLARVIHPD